MKVKFVSDNPKQKKKKKEKKGVGLETYGSAEKPVKKKKRWIKITLINFLILFGGLIVGVLFIGYANSNDIFSSKVKPGDFKFEFQWDTDSYNLRYDEGKFSSYLQVNSISDRSNIYYRMYDKETGVEYTTPGKFGSRSFRPESDYRAEAGVSYKMTLENYDDSKELRLCVSNKRDFNINSENIICRDYSIQGHQISTEISPDFIRIDTTEYSDGYGEFKLINKGKTTTTFWCGVKGITGRDSIPAIFCRTKDTEKSAIELAPGEAATFEIRAAAYSDGVYDIKGIIAALQMESNLYADFAYTHTFDIKVYVDEYSS